MLPDNFVHGSAAVSNFNESDGVLGSEGLRVSQVSYVKSYTHELIHGVGEVQLQYRYSLDGKTEFTGYELFSGAIGDRKGSVVLSITGSVNSKNSVASAAVEIHPGSGSSELYKLSGSGSFVFPKAGLCSFEFTLRT